MWNLLRMEPFRPFHFRRQVPLGPYYADFASHTARLVIEIDGASHTFGDAVAYDARRTAFIATQGYRELRFNTIDVLKGIEGVAEVVLAACTEGAAQAAPPTHRKRRSPLPTSGRES